MKYSLSFAILICCWVCAAQVPQIEAISVEHGLSQGFISSIVEDDDGFLWFGTNNGLNRYDGYDFIHFKKEANQKYTLPTNEVLSIANGGRYIYLRFMNGAFHMFDRKKHLSIPLESIPEDNYIIRRIVSNEKDVLWCLIDIDNVGYLYELDRTGWDPLLNKEESKANPAWRKINISGSVANIGFSNTLNKLWVVCLDSLVEYDYKSERVTRYELPEILKGYTIEKSILQNGLSVSIPDDKGLWVITDQKSYYFDGSVWESHLTSLKNQRELLTDDEKGMIWIRSDSLIYGYSTERIRKKGIEGSTPVQVVIDEKIKTAIADRNGNIWIGTDAKGIRKLIANSGVFENFLSNRSVYAPLVADKSGNVWVAHITGKDKTGGLLSTETGMFRTYAELGLMVHANDGTRIVLDENGEAWIMSRNGWNSDDNIKNPTLIKFSLENGVQKIISVPKTFETSRFDMLYSDGGIIWGINGYQVLKFNTKSEEFQIYEDLSLKSGTVDVYCVVKTSGASWWLATSKGLLHFTIASDGTLKTAIVEETADNLNTFGLNSIKSLYLDSKNKNVLWIGTNGNGLIKMNISQKAFRRYTELDGLSDNTIYGIVPEQIDSDSQTRILWLSTNRGLTRFDIVNEEFRRFYKTNGLQDNEFNTFSFGKMPDGRLLFGGISGLSIVDPEKVEMDHRMPAPFLTKLHVNGNLVLPNDTSNILKHDIAYTSEIILPFDQNNIQLYFASNDLTLPNLNQFSYYLQGAEREWMHHGTDRSAQYLNLAPGKYHFKLKVANRTGTWSEDHIELAIRILPPWYSTYWAYFIYALVIGGLIFYFYRSHVNRIIEQAEADRLRELDAFKTKFFVNITHEFRTPLTVILGLVNEAKINPGAYSAKSLSRLTEPIERNGKRLLHLINQLLDLSKLENNALKPSMVNGDVIKFLKYIIESMQSLANMQNQVLRIRTSLISLNMDFDPERLTQIMSNLLSNALKHAPSGGSVIVHIEKEHAGHLNIRVQDNGKGIPEKELPRIFDRFYQVDENTINQTGRSNLSSEGSGIGLALTKELVHMLDGSIHVESSTMPPNQGTTFTIKLPIKTEATEETDVKPVLDLWIVPSEQNAAKSIDNETDSDQALILLVEDNADVVDFMINILAPAFRIKVAYNGISGETIAVDTIPDLIVSDLMMPDKDGLELCKSIKSDERTSHIPFILLTARAAVEDRILGLTTGADAYLTKPFHRDELLATINGLIEQRQKLQAYYEQSMTSHHEQEKMLSSERPDPFLEKLRITIEENLSNAQFSIESLSQKMAMSQTQLYRKTKALTGKNPTQFVRDFRMQKALKLLKNGETRINEISYSVGIDDPKYFSRVFSETFGVPPTSWKSIP